MKKKIQDEAYKTAFSLSPMKSIVIEEEGFDSAYVNDQLIMPEEYLELKDVVLSFTNELRNCSFFFTQKTHLHKVEFNVNSINESALRLSRLYLINYRFKK